MSGSIVKKVTQVLNSQHYYMNESWLDGCINYYISDNANWTQQEVVNFAIEQWHLSDLHQINNEKAVLPKNLDKEMCITLKGSYILQMDKVCDISKPKLQQLEQIRKISQENVEATEAEYAESQTQFAKSKYEPKKKRVLYLDLTDGTQDVKAMEYKPINFSLDTYPGCKVMITGPVICRRGVILLSNENIKVIGGEVDDLLIPNAIENVLARALNLKENPDPYNDKKENNENTINAELQNNKNKVNRSTERTEVDNLLNQDDDLMELINDFHDFPERIPSITEYRSETLENKGTKEKDKNCNNDRQVSLLPMKASLTVSGPSNTLQDFKYEERKTVDKSQNTKNQTNFGDFDLPSDIVIDDDDDFLFDAISPAEDGKKEIHAQSSGIDRNRTALVSSPSFAGQKRPASEMSPPLESNPQKVPCTAKSSRVTSSKENSSNRKITDFLGAKKKVPEPTTTSSTQKICDFICDIVKERITTIVYRTIRCKVVSLGKLKPEDDSWYLEATITDETANLDVTFSPETLRTMIGFDVKDFREKKKQFKTNPSLKEEVRASFHALQNKLEKLDSLVIVEFSENTEAKIIGLGNLTDQQRRIIDEQIQMMKK